MNRYNRFAALLGAVVVGAFVAIGLGADEPVRVRFDLTFPLEQGDEAYILDKRPVIRRAEDYVRVGKLFLARDVEGLQGMTDQGDIYWTDGPTKARVLEKDGHTDPMLFEVRILDGPTKGQSGYCLNGSVFRGTLINQRRPGTNNRESGPSFEFEMREKKMCMQLFDQIVPRMDLAKRQPKRLAERLLSVGQECIQDGDKAGAMKVYQMIQNEFPDSVEAREAAARIVALAIGK